MKQATLLLPLLTAFAIPSQAQDAVVEKYLTEFEVTGARSAQCHEMRVYRINNERAESLTSMAISCSNDRDLGKFSATITDESGKVLKKIKKGDLNRSEYSEHFATDAYFYYIDYKPTTYPVTVTFDWEENYSGGVLSYPSFYPQNIYDTEVKEATYRITIPDGEELRWQSLNCQPDISKRVEKNKNVYEVKMGPIPALKRQSWGLDFDERVPIIYFAPPSFDYKGTHCDLTDWQSYGRWSWGLLQGRDQLPQPLIDKLHALTDTCQTTLSKIETVRKFMGETTRYVSIQLGIGGWQPMTAADVYQKGIGDCKALSNYFCSMLHALDIPADYVCISTDDRNMLPGFPTMQQFNHVVARVPLPNDTLWVECTNPYLPVGYAPDSWAGHDALVITSEGGVQTTVPILADNECREENHFSITLDAQGQAIITTHSVMTGREWEDAFGITLRTIQDQKKSIQSNYRLPTATVSEVKHNSQGTTLTSDWTATSQGYAKRTGSRLFVPISPIQYQTPRQRNDEPHPLDLRESGYVRIDSVTLTLPEGYELETLPKPRTIDTPMATYSLNVSQASEGSTEEPIQITIVAQMQLRSGLYTADDALATWLQFIKDRSQANDSKLVIKKKL